MTQNIINAKLQSFTILHSNGAETRIRFSVDPYVTLWVNDERRKPHEMDMVQLENWVDVLGAVYKNYRARWSELKRSEMYLAMGLEVVIMDLANRYGRQFRTETRLNYQEWETMHLSWR